MTSRAAGGGSIISALRDVHHRLAREVPELTGARFTVDVKDVGAWLSDVARATGERDFVIADPGVPDTIYVEMNDFAFTMDRWFVSAIAFARPEPGSSVQVSEWFDELAGHEVGDLRPMLDLTGMELAQEWFALRLRDRDSYAGSDPLEELVTDLVRLSMFDLLDQGLRVSDFPYRLAARLHEEPVLCLWEDAESVPRVPVISIDPEGC